MNYKTYEKYKNTSTDWISNIPSHWETNRFKITFSYSKGKNPQTFSDEKKEGYAPYLSMEYLRNDIDPTYVPIKECPLKANDGDILLLWDGSNAGEFVVSKGGLVSSTMAKLTPNIRIDNNLSKYLCKSIEPLLRELTIGMGVPHVSTTKLNNIQIPTIPLAEQKQIANYLDKQTAKIDATIAKNKELIELLEEKRVALINQVVTKGLNPDVPMKYSDVEWIGKIPEHWNIMKLKHHGFVLGGYAFKSGDFTDSGVKVVKITNVQSLKFDWSECFYLPKSYLHEHSEFKINKGDIIFALTRPIISTGIKAAIFDENEPALANQRTGIFKKHSNDLISTFLYYVIYSDYFKEDFKSKITATNQPNISPLDIGEIKLILPSVEEQKQIVSKLDEETKKISEVISKIKENINLLEEYKTSLIHNVVTGKIDVREEVI